MSVSERALGWILTVGGAVGVAAAFVLTVERFALAADANYIPSCSLNPVLSCGSVMATSQAAAFGFPNPLLGLVGFPVVITLGVQLLAGNDIPRWMWLGLQAGASLGVIFVHWLIYQSLYEIGALCPYCMAVWVAMITVFWYVTLRTLAGTKTLPKPARRATALFAHNHTFVLTLWLLTVAALIGIRFWDYWNSLV